MIDESRTRTFKLGVLSRRGPIAIDSQNIPHLAHIGGLSVVLPELANHCEVNWSVLDQSPSGESDQKFSYQDLSTIKQPSITLAPLAPYEDLIFYLLPHGKMA